MPKKFDECVKAGGKVRTVAGPRKEKPKLKTDEYIHICIAPDGGRYWGYKKKKKTKKELEMLLTELKEVFTQNKDFVDELKKALMSSDISGLLKPGGIPIFQNPEKKKKKVKRIKISLEDITSETLQDLSDVEIYKKHNDIHTGWNETDINREELKNVHRLIVQEFKNKEMIHHFWDSLDDKKNDIKEVEIVDTVNQPTFNVDNTANSGTSHIKVDYDTVTLTMSKKKK